MPEKYIEPFPDEFIEKLQGKLAKTAKTINSLIEHDIKEPIPVMVRKLLHNILISGLMRLELLDLIDRYITEIDPLIAICAQLGLISNKTASNLKKAKLLGDNLAHSIFGDVYLQNVYHDIRTVQIAIDELESRIADLSTKPKILRQKVDSILQKRKKIPDPASQPKIREKKEDRTEFYNYLQDLGFLHESDEEVLKDLSSLELNNLSILMYNDTVNDSLVFVRIFNQADSISDIILILKRLVTGIVNKSLAYSNKIDRINKEINRIKVDWPTRGEKLLFDIQELRNKLNILKNSRIVIYKEEFEDIDDLKKQFQEICDYHDVSFSLEFLDPRKIADSVGNT
ncbi:MAG: hypothetical protein ACFFD2_15725 [Promethearchaeota archaeon]